MKRIELRQICVEELLARIIQDISDNVPSNVRVPVSNELGDALSKDSDSDDGCLEISDSDW